MAQRDDPRCLDDRMRSMMIDTLETIVAAIPERVDAGVRRWLDQRLTVIAGSAASGRALHHLSGDLIALGQHLETLQGVFDEHAATMNAAHLEAAA